jgi:uncharacterized protein YggE
LAFQKALDKAKQYAALSGKTLIGVRNITESDSRDTQFLQSNTLSSRTLAYVGDDRYSSIPMGEQEITTEIKVEYTMEN